MEFDYSLDALARFFDYAVEKGLMKRQTAMGRKIAALKVLGSLDTAETQDLREVEVGEASRRFSNMQGGNYKPESLRVYTSRTKSAVSEFIRYVNDPPSFKPSIPQRRDKQKGAQNVSKGSVMQPKTNARETTQPHEPDAQQPNARSNIHTLAIPIPIRDGMMIQLQGVPADLTADEAEKIANVVKAYASIGS